MTKRRVILLETVPADPDAVPNTSADTHPARPRICAHPKSWAAVPDQQPSRPDNESEKDKL